jgi:hypothetical protein
MKGAAHRSKSGSNDVQGKNVSVFLSTEKSEISSSNRAQLSAFSQINFKPES